MKPITPEQLDANYTALAQAIAEAGAQSELYLAMLSLKFITQSEAEKAKNTIASTLKDLKRLPA